MKIFLYERIEKELRDSTKEDQNIFSIIKYTFMSGEKKYFDIGVNLIFLYNE